MLTSNGSYQAVTGVMAHKHVGRIFELKIRSMGSIHITEEHKVLVVRRKSKYEHNRAPFEFEWTEAGNLKKLDYVTYPKPVRSASVNFLTFSTASRNGLKQKTVAFTPEFFRLAGYYVSEGNTIGKPETVYCRQILFTFGSKEMELAQDTAQLLDHVFGLKATIRRIPRKNTITVLANSSLIAKAFVEWFGHGAQNKHVPAEMMLAEPWVQRDLIKGLWRGDGWIGSNRAQYSTISRRLAEQMKLLLLRQDIVSSMEQSKPRPGHRPSFKPKVCNPYVAHLEALVNGQTAKTASALKINSIQTESRLLLPIMDVIETPYSGVVYNLEVAGIEDYCTSAGIVHNCAACAGVSPDFWTMNDDGKSDVVGGKKMDDETEELDIQDQDFDTNMEAAQSCPVNVIHLVKKDSGEKII
ncbi:ferredoxin [Candidatus Micrarchaeota archaeon]|nr:ferredoxin [Candidatus Micrarchaeota archaeon]